MKGLTKESYGENLFSNSSAPLYTIICIRSSYDLHIVQSRDKTMHNLERDSEETKFGSQSKS